MKYANAALENRTLRCHISKGALCLHTPLKDIGVKYYRALIAYSRMINWADFAETPGYVKTMFDTDYWFAVNATKGREPMDQTEYYIFWSTFSAIVFVITVLLFAIYLRTGRGEFYDENVVLRRSAGASLSLAGSPKNL